MLEVQHPITKPIEKVPRVQEIRRDRCGLLARPFSQTGKMQSLDFFFRTEKIHSYKHASINPPRRLSGHR